MSSTTAVRDGHRAGSGPDRIPDDRFAGAGDGLRLYEFRPARLDGIAVPPGRIVLVVAASEDAAAAAVRSALVPDEGIARAVDWFEFNDLGAHEGPEEAGSVFVNGYGIRW